MHSRHIMTDTSERNLTTTTTTTTTTNLFKQLYIISLHQESTKSKVVSLKKKSQILKLTDVQTHANGCTVYTITSSFRKRHEGYYGLKYIDTGIQQM